MLSLWSNWAAFLYSTSLYLAHHCAIWICVYYPFAIILSSPLRLALFESRIDLAASMYMTGDMRSSCKNRNQISRRSTKKRDMFQRLKVPLGFARYVSNCFMVKYTGRYFFPLFVKLYCADVVFKNIYICRFEAEYMLPRFL